MSFLKFVINYKVTKEKIKDILWELLYGYDILVTKKGKITVKVTYPPPNQKTLQVDELVDYEVRQNTLVIYVKLDAKKLENIEDFIWIKYILNIIEQGVYVDQIEFLNIPKKEQFFIRNKKILSKIDKITYKGARGIILKGYSKLYNDWIINNVKKLLDKKCTIVKEDETFAGNFRDLKKRLEVLSNYSEFIYVFNSIIFNNNYIKPMYNGVLAVPLVPYLARGFSLLTEWSYKGFPVWGNRHGYFLIKHYVSKKVYLKLALLAGAYFLHVGTPQSKSEFQSLKKLIKDLRKIRPFIPVFTGTPDSETEENLLKISDNRAVFLSPRYWEGCK